MLELDWQRRRTAEETWVARHLIRTTKCGRYRVVYSIAKYADAWAPRWCAMVDAGGDRVYWKIISIHKKESTARTACTAHARQQEAKGAAKRRKRKVEDDAAVLFHEAGPQTFPARGPAGA